jgi:adenylate cyclase
MAPKRTLEDQWRAMLTGELPRLARTRRIMLKIPSGPRCKLCAAPFGKPGMRLVRLAGFGRSTINRRMCNGCIRHITKMPGGTELEISLLFADVRGSTRLAQLLPAHEFSALIARFYGTAAKVIDEHDGIVDKFVGDEAMALFIPGIAGDEHASRAVQAARELLHETGHAGGSPWVPLGAGVHTGTAYVGTVGEGDALDFTALGDAVNATARLAADAGPGEILISDATARAARLDTTGMETRRLTLRGREGQLDTYVSQA